MKRLLLATSVLFRINLCGAPKAEANGTGPTARANATAPHPPPPRKTASENRHYVRACCYKAARSAWPCDSFDMSILIAPSTAHFTAETPLRLYTFALITSCHSRGISCACK